MREDKISLGGLIELAHSNFGGNCDYDRVMVEVDYEYFGPCEPDDEYREMGEYMGGEENFY